MAEEKSHAITKSYTRAGDAGKTALVGGERVSKSNLRIGVCGSLDELNAWLGYIRSQHTLEKELDLVIGKIQTDLFTIGALIANPHQATVGRDISFDARQAVAQLEQSIDPINEKLPLLMQFILPGGTKTASLFHIARTITRRTERLVVALAEQEEIDQGLIAYLNRLSSLFFVYARYINFKSGMKEQTW